MNLPPYPRFPTLSDDKITLREIQLSDLPDLLEIASYDSVKATTVEQAAEMQKKIYTDYLNGNSIHWGIEDKRTNRIAGTCGYYRGLADGEGELGCILLPKYRGQGFMAPALQLAIDFGKNEIGLRRIWAATTVQNEKAIHLLKKLHFVQIDDPTGDQIEFELSTGFP